MPNPNSIDTEFDVIVIGVGGMGSATSYELARRGARVVGLERFSFGHDRGSSHGESRIIRKAYFEHPDYVPLLHRAYERWHELEIASSRTLFHPTGLVLSGPANGETIRGARLSAELHNLELENLTPNEARQRFPGLEFPEEHDVAFEPGAGTLFVDECVRTHIDQAIRHGAVLRENEVVLSWSTDGQKVKVISNAREYVGRHLIITAGAWTDECLEQLRLKLNVIRKFVAWFPLKNDDRGTSSRLPNYFFEMPTGAFYGFPSFDRLTMKIAEHSGGKPVADPLAVDRTCHPSDLERLKEFISASLPNVNPNPAKSSVCLYTMTPDQHFVIDLHPNWKNVAFAAGFSGHGFKFCPVVGEVLADLILQKKTSLPIQFLARNRGFPSWQPDS